MPVELIRQGSRIIVRDSVRQQIAQLLARIPPQQRAAVEQIVQLRQQIQPPK